ncbi:hypothetical protein CEXT_657931 [Caerostris extrusa]|uniref:Uncharacterized protein n=1 Tax=Caerostris extrusa TaxID=172846 RepID=A0AAV4VS80_CAEEX|nr:hypothetical protein CEXT_657931 [Caerostris extrusa]
MHSNTGFIVFYAREKKKKKLSVSRTFPISTILEIICVQHIDSPGKKEEVGIPSSVIYEDCLYLERCLYIPAPLRFTAVKYLEWDFKRRGGKEQFDYSRFLPLFSPCSGCTRALGTLKVRL